MNQSRITWTALALVIISVWVAASTCDFGTCQAATAGASSMGVKESRIVRAISENPKQWVEKELMQGHAVVLTNAYLFQVMKGIAQENQKAIEETVLIPLLRKTLDGLFQAAKDPDTRRLFGVPLMLLGGNSESEFPQEVVDQAKEIQSNPMFQPRGHYTDSPELERYFLAMQYLAKATIDVSINRRFFSFPDKMLFPFETVVSVTNTLQDPAHKNLLAQWSSIHAFYSAVNGDPDSPTFTDLVDAFQQGEFDRKAIEGWAKKRGLPAINPERGLGIQPFGERFSLHQGVIDERKRKLGRDGMPREKIAEILRFSDLLAGKTGQGQRTRGLGMAASKENGKSYYSKVLRAISTGAKGSESNRFRMNFFAAALTSLAEQTALMTKTSIMVEKSLPETATIPKGVKLYFEAGSEPFLKALAEASATMARLCKGMRDRSPGESGQDLNVEDPSAAFRAFAKLAAQQRPLITGSPLWNSYGRFVSELVRNPTVTVDVFQLKDRSGKVSFYQWAVAPFVRVGTRGAKGMEMVFFESWSDEIVPQHEGPLTNQQWQDRLQGGKLHLLNSLITIPRLKEVR